MSLGHGAKIVRDGLVFYYDMDNTKKSWKGKPTTNLSRTMADAHGGSTSLSYPEVVYQCSATKTNIIDFTAPGGQYSRFIGTVDATTNNQLYTRFNTAGIDVRNSTITYSVYLRGSGTCHLTIYADNAGYGESPLITLTNEWVRYSYTRSVTNYTTNCWVAVRGILLTTDVYIANQQSEINGFVTPFVDGTRTNTEALLDMTNKNIITVNELTYKSDGLFDFTGTNNYASFGDGINIHDMGSNITVEAWVKYNNYASTNGQSYSVVTCKGTQWTWLMENPSNKLRFRIHAGGVDTNIASPNIHPLNTWIHCVGTYDGTTMRIYENGIETNSKAQTGALGITTNTAKIGCYTPTSYSIDGEIAIVKIHNTTLTADEIKQNFNATKGRFGL
jgi:hypothetical protein